MALNIDESLMWDDIRSVIEGDSSPSAVYEVILHTEDEDIDIDKLVSIDIIRDYVSAYSDQVVAKVLVPLGTHVHRIKPYVSNLEATIVITKGDEVSEVRYKAILPEDQENSGDDDTLLNYLEEDLNHIDIVLLNLQLVLLQVEPLKLPRVRGVFKGLTREALLNKTLLGKANTYSIDGKPPIDGIKMAPPNNTTTIVQTLIPTDTPLLKFPRTIQEQHGGVYAGGIGSYVQAYKGTVDWYLYPPYDPSNPVTTDESVVVLVLDTTTVSEFPVTYKTEGNVFTILAGASELNGSELEPRMSVLTEGYQLNDANAVINNPLTVSPTSLTSTRDKISQRVLHREHVDGLNPSAISPYESTVNYYHRASQLAQNTGYRLDLVWYNSTPGHLHPGMSVSIYTEANGTVVIRQASVLFNHTLYALSGGMGNHLYETVTYISVFIRHAT